MNLIRGFCELFSLSRNLFFLFLRMRRETLTADSFLRSKSLSLITKVLTTIGIIVRIIYWKINAGSPPKAKS